MSSEVNNLRDVIYKDYEFWLGCYETDKEHWKSGVIHAYHNVLCEMDKRKNDNCPCHVCTGMRERKR